MGKLVSSIDAGQQLGYEEQGRDLLLDDLLHLNVTLETMATDGSIHILLVPISGPSPTRQKSDLRGDPNVQVYILVGVCFYEWEWGTLKFIHFLANV